jgi:hypothetical protein
MTLLAATDGAALTCCVASVAARLRFCFHIKVVVVVLLLLLLIRDNVMCVCVCACFFRHDRPLRMDNMVVVENFDCGGVVVVSGFCVDDSERSGVRHSPVHEHIEVVV